jgi:hypothetical protein
VRSTRFLGARLERPDEPVKEHAAEVITSAIHIAVRHGRAMRINHRRDTE